VFDDLGNLLYRNWFLIKVDPGRWWYREPGWYRVTSIEGFRTRVV